MKPGRVGPTSVRHSEDNDAVIMAYAARQHGVVARWQLIQARVATHVIDFRVKKKRLLRLYRGVYRVGPVSAPFAEEMAAVLASGDQAVVSHRSAASLWRMIARDDRATVDVSISGGCRYPGAGVRVHRVSGLPGDEVAEVGGIPITSPARTLLDLASCSNERELEQALALTFRERLATVPQIERILVRFPRRSGSGKLRALIAPGSRLALTRSEAEERFLKLVRKSQLRMPEVNVVVNGYEVDFLWRAELLVVEIDGHAFHGSRRAFERDRRRDAVQAAAGLRVMRLTWRQISSEPEAVLVRLAQALARA